MFRRFFLLLAIAAVISGGARIAAAGSEAAGLEKTYDQFYQAVTDKNFEKMLSFIAPECEFVDEKGKRSTLVEYRKEMEDFFGKSGDHKIDFQLKDVQFSGSRAEVYVEEKHRMEMRSERPKGWMPINTMLRAEQTWDKSSGSWKLIKSKILRTQAAVDAEWMARRLKELDDAAALTMPCNFSYNGCR